MTRKFSNLTAVVCTLNSENSLERCLVSLVEIVDFLIVVDGGSTDDTVSQAVYAGAQVVVSPTKGRAAQMNFGNLTKN